MPVLASLKSRQAERLSAREALLAAFDTFKGKHSDRSSLDLFVGAFHSGHVELPEWCRPLVSKLSRRTLERWLAARAAGRDEDLAGRWAGGRKSVFDLSPELAEFVLGVHAQQPAIQVEELAGLVAVRFPQGVADQAGVMMAHPSPATVRRFLARWKDDAHNMAVLTAVTDPDRYRSAFRFALGNASFGIERPNQRWQIDASPADVLCSDGRHSIYVVVDCYSRRLLAIVTKTPRTVAVLLLIARAIQAWGVPGTICTDNGSDFKSKHFVLALRQLGIAHHVMPPYSPERKAFVERAIGTIQKKFMPLIEGYAGANVAQRSKIEGRRSFAQRMGMDEKELLGANTLSGDLQDALLAWIANRYETRPHAGLAGRTPLQAWNEALDTDTLKWADPAAIGQLLMAPARDAGNDRGNVAGVRTVGKKGVSVDGIDYVCSAMVIGQRVAVRLDPDDLGKVWLYTDADPWRFVGVATNADLLGVDRAEAAAKQRALQAAAVKQGTAEIRRLIRKADTPAIARLYIGALPQGASEPSNVTHLTPALAEAHRAATTRGRTVIEPATPEEKERHAAFVARFDEAEPAKEETGADRYARWKALRAAADRGEEIPADLADWLNEYPQHGEWKAQRMLRDDNDADNRGAGDASP